VVVGCDFTVMMDFLAGLEEKEHGFGCYGRYWQGLFW
jgi:hypothetical protein